MAMNLEDQMNVARDADRMSTRDIKNAKARAKRAAAKAAAVMNTELPEPAPVAAVPVVGQPTIRPEVDESASAAAAPVAKETPEPVKITVKKAGNDGRKVLLTSGKLGKFSKGYVAG